jgi:hypothetical protein
MAVNRYFLEHCSTVFVFLALVITVRMVSARIPSELYTFAVPFFWALMGVFSLPVFVEETTLNFMRNGRPSEERAIDFRPAIIEMVRLYTTSIILLMEIVRTVSLKGTRTLTAEHSTPQQQPFSVWPTQQQQPFFMDSLPQLWSSAGDPNCYPPNSDIAGLGVRVSVYMLLWTTILSLAIGSFHCGQSGTKELGIAVMSSKDHTTSFLTKNAILTV